MNERLKVLRKYFKLSQREFCRKLGMSQPTYAAFETGARELKDAYLKLICISYNVNEQWLRDGVGEMFIKEPNHELAELLEVFDILAPALQKYLLKQARELQELQNTERQ